MKVKQLEGVIKYLKERQTPRRLRSRNFRFAETGADLGAGALINLRVGASAQYFNQHRTINTQSKQASVRGENFFNQRR